MEVSTRIMKRTAPSSSAISIGQVVAVVKFEMDRGRISVSFLGSGPPWDSTSLDVVWRDSKGLWHLSIVHSRTAF
ncbi:hypothetical protein LINPERHAP2_LOCUS22221 [Linum perenne]